MNQQKGMLWGKVLLIRNLLKLCRFSKTETDSGNRPEQQIEYLGKAVDGTVIMPYGTHANIPEDFLGVLFQLSTQEQNRVVLPLSLIERPHPIESGEVVFFHPVTGSKIHFKNNGDIDITTGTDVNVNCANANIIASVKATVTAPESEFIGNVTVTGDLTVTGSTALSDTVTSNSVDISDTHLHSGVTTGGSNTGAPV